MLLALPGSGQSGCHNRHMNHVDRFPISSQRIRMNGLVEGLSSTAQRSDNWVDAA